MNIIEPLVAVLNHVSEALLVEDDERQIVFVNKRFCLLLNINAIPDELIQKPTASLHTVFADNINNVQKFITDIETTVLLVKLNCRYFFLPDLFLIRNSFCVVESPTDSFLKPLISSYNSGNNSGFKKFSRG